MNVLRFCVARPCTSPYSMTWEPRLYVLCADVRSFTVSYCCLSEFRVAVARVAVLHPRDAVEAPEAGVEFGQRDRVVA